MNFGLGFIIDREGDTLTVYIGLIFTIKITFKKKRDYTELLKAMEE